MPRKELHQAEHRAGRKLLCQALGCNEADVLIASGGKPYLPGGPHFSISHSHGFVLLAVCGDSSIGCDVEPITRTVHNEEAILRKLLPIGADTKSTCENQSFLKLWVAHEAMFKSGLGKTGQVIYPNMPEGWVAAVCCAKNNNELRIMHYEL